MRQFLSRQCSRSDRIVTTQLVFEDPYEDEFESDGEVVDAAGQERESEGGDGAEMDELEEQLRVWRPGIDKLAEDEVSSA